MILVKNKIIAYLISVISVANMSFVMASDNNVVADINEKIAGYTYVDEDNAKEIREAYATALKMIEEGYDVDLTDEFIGLYEKSLKTRTPLADFQDMEFEAVTNYGGSVYRNDDGSLRIDATNLTDTTKFITAGTEFENPFSGIVNMEFKVKRDSNSAYAKVYLNMKSDGGEIPVTAMHLRNNYAVIPFFKDCNSYFWFDENASDKNFAVNTYEKIKLQLNFMNRTMRIFIDGEEITYRNASSFGNITSNPQNPQGEYEINANALESIYFYAGIKGYVDIDELYITNEADDLVNDIAKLPDAKELTSDYREEVKTLIERYNVLERYLLSDGVVNYDKLEEAYSALFYVSSNGDYKIDIDEMTISGIKYNTDITDFLNIITVKEGYNVKVMRNGEQVTEEAVKSGDILCVYSGVDTVVAEFVLDVIAPSTDNHIKSDVYIVEDGIITGVEYNTPVDVFISKIITDDKAEIVIKSYAPGYSGGLFENFEVLVIAENGDERTYDVIVNKGSSNVLLSSEIYEVYNDLKLISGIKTGTSVSELKNSLTLEKGKRFKVLDLNMQEKTAGVITGEEFIRVYPYYQSAENPYYDYLLNVSLWHTDMSINSSNASYKGTWLVSSAPAGMDGLSAIVAQTDDSVLTFDYKIPFSGKVNVYAYTSEHSTNGVAKNNTFVINGEEYAAAAFDTKGDTGFKYIDSCNVNTGDDFSVVFRGNNGNLRITGIRIEIEADSFVDKVVIGEAVTDETRTLDNVSREFDKISVFLKEESNEGVLKNIKLVSENGHETKCDVNVLGNEVSIIPQTELVGGLSYYLLTGLVKNMEGAQVKSNEIYKINIAEGPSKIIVRNVYYDENGYITDKLSNAKKVRIYYEFNKDAEGIKLSVIQFSGKKYVQCISLDVTEKEGTADMDIIGECSEIKVIALTENGYSAVNNVKYEE